MAERNNCLISKGSKVDRGQCSNNAALKWNLSKDGQLSSNGGKMCVVRFTDDTAGMAKCSEAYEHIRMVAPETIKADDIENALKNPNLTPEQRKALTEYLKTSYNA
jgi:hypothetical protein